MSALALIANHFNMQAHICEPLQIKCVLAGENSTILCSLCMLPMLSSILALICDSDCTAVEVLL